MLKTIYKVRQSLFNKSLVGFLGYVVTSILTKVVIGHDLKVFKMSFRKETLSKLAMRFQDRLYKTKNQHTKKVVLKLRCGQLFQQLTSLPYLFHQSLFNFKYNLPEVVTRIFNFKITSRPPIQFSIDVRRQYSKLFI